MLLDCKNKSYTPQYDSGDYNSVRNISSALSRDAQIWQQKVEALRDNPVGDNYDFRGFHLVGAVVTPTTFYVQVGSATEWVEDPDRLIKVRAVCSLGELERELLH